MAEGQGKGAGNAPSPACQDLAVLAPSLLSAHSCRATEGCARGAVSVRAGNRKGEKGKGKERRHLNVTRQPLHVLLELLIDRIDLPL